jgi:hypothetical protein
VAAEDGEGASGGGLDVDVLAVAADGHGGGAGERLGVGAVTGDGGILGAAVEAGKLGERARRLVAPEDGNGVGGRDVT